MVDKLIALDYDGTYTADPPLWNSFIQAATKSGHRVICITMRTPQESIQIPCDVYYTSRKAKIPFMRDLGIKVNIWIDDMPELLFQGAG